MNFKHFLQSGMNQNSLPWYLRVHFFIAIIFAAYCSIGLIFTLPVGPLCDEGMILFMEGSCDWGGSNLFFYAKLMLIVGANFLVGAFLIKKFSINLAIPHLTSLFIFIFLTLDELTCRDSV